MSRKATLIAFGLAALAAVLWGQLPVLVLKDGGIEFPDGSVQDTAAAAAGGTSSLLDPVKSFTVVREHQYTGTSDPTMPPLQFLQGGLGGLLGVNDDTDQPPNHANPVLDPQFRLGVITPCDGVIPTVNNFVATGIDITMSAVDGATGFVDSILLVELTPAGAPAFGPTGRRFESFRPPPYHDSVGIRFSGQNTMGVMTRVRVSGALTTGPTPMVIPAIFRVVTVITGYCADESLNPPQDN